MRKNPVLVLHGLGMNRLFMHGLTQHLRSGGRNVYSISYPSRSKSFSDIVDQHLVPAIEQGLHDKNRGDKMDFVGHSMGGLLVRLYAKKYGTEHIGRVVMLATPNGGSQVADFMKRWDVFRHFCGTVGPDLGTGPADLHAQLPRVPFECGVIAGENALLHYPTTYLANIPVPNDGIVSVESTRVEGMKAHIVIPADHTQIVWSPKAWDLTSRFLETGAFA